MYGDQLVTDLSKLPKHELIKRNEMLTDELELFTGMGLLVRSVAEKYVVSTIRSIVTDSLHNKFLSFHLFVNP